jgi:hypothetical protein
MQRSLLLACLSSLLCVALGCPAGTGTELDAERASAPPSDGISITQANVYERERYWPAIVVLTRQWLPPGETKPLEAQYRGTLVRVEAGGSVRVDFGRHGKHDVPMDHTDLVERANEVRAGALVKLAPNFVLRVGNSLVDASSQPMRPYKLVEIADASGFLCVFADPRAEDFPNLAQQLAALEGVNGVRTVFFPQVPEDLESLHERLGTLPWHVAYMYPRLSRNYTLSLLGEIPERPHALLVSPEGRVLHRAEVGTAAGLDELREAVESVPPPDPKGAAHADAGDGGQESAPL